MGICNCCTRYYRRRYSSCCDSSINRSVILLFAVENSIWKGRAPIRESQFVDYSDPHSPLLVRVPHFSNVQNNRYTSLNFREVAKTTGIPVSEEIQQQYPFIYFSLIIMILCVVVMNMDCSTRSLLH